VGVLKRRAAFTAWQCRHAVLKPLIHSGLRRQLRNSLITCVQIKEKAVFL
jgi:hypothetical protein